MSDQQPKELSFGANAVLNVSAWFVPAVTALIAVPITVRGLGPDAYGLLALVGTLIGYLGLMELGLGAAIVRYLSYYRALNEGRPMLGIIRFAVTWFGAIGVVGGVVLVVGAPWFAQSLLKVPADLLTTGITVIRITGFGFCTAMLVMVGAVIPTAFLRYDIAALMTVTFGVLGSAGPAVLVTLGYGLIGIVIFSVATDLAAIVCYTVIAVRLFRPIDKAAGPEWITIRRQTLRFAGITALNQIHSAISKQTSRLVVGVAGGVAAAAYYQVPAMLASRVSTMLGRAAYVIFPTASGMKARNDEEGVRRLYLRTSRLFFVVNGCTTAALCALAYPLLEYWVSPDYAQQGALALVFFLISSCLDGSTMAASYVNLSAARPGVNLIFALSNSIISLSTIYPLTVRWGVTGAALSWLLGSANVPFYFLYVHKHILELSSWRVFRRCYLPTIVGSIPVGLLVFFFLAPLLSNLAVTLAAFIAVTLACMVASGLLGAIKREDVRELMGMAKGLWRRLLVGRRPKDTNVD